MIKDKFDISLYIKNWSNFDYSDVDGDYDGECDNDFDGEYVD